MAPPTPGCREIWGDIGRIHGDVALSEYTWLLLPQVRVRVRVRVRARARVRVGVRLTWLLLPQGSAHVLRSWHREHKARTPL